MPESLKIEGKMNVHIITPTHVVLDSVADKILLPTPNGNIMILRNRAPLFTSVAAGLLWVYNAGLPPEAYYVNKGVAEIRRDICSVIAWAIKADEVNSSQIHKQRLKEEEKLEKTRTGIQKENLKDTIAFLKMMEDKPNILIPPKFE